MSVYSSPTLYNGLLNAVFNINDFIKSTESFIKFPNAQGDVVLQNATASLITATDLRVNNNVRILGTTIATSLITATGGLTIGGANNITLGSGATSPIVGQIGYIYTYILPTTSQSGGINYNFNPTAGVWLVYAYIEANTTQNGNFFYELKFSGLRKAFSASTIYTANSGFYLPSITASGYFNGSQTVSLYVNYAVATTLTSSNFYAIRIA